MDGSVNSNYHALSAKIQQRFSRGLSYMVAYTYSKAIDGGSALRTNSGDRLWPINSYDLSAERGRSQFHVGQRFVSSALYELPFGRGKMFLNTSSLLDKFIGGWQLGGIVTLSGGTPVNVGQIGDSFARRRSRQQHTRDRDQPDSRESDGGPVLESRRIQCE